MTLFRFSRFAFNTANLNTNRWSKSYTCFCKIPKPSNFNQTRTFVNIFKAPRKSELKLIDNVPDQYELIYRSTMERQITISNAVICVASIIGGIMAVIKWSQPVNIQNFDDNGKFIPPAPAPAEFYIFFTIFACFIMALQYLVKKTPLRIYYYPRGRNYVFIFNSLMPTQIRRVSCAIGEVRHTPESSVLPWKECIYEIKNKQDVILLEDNFRTIADLYIMMGVQRDHDVED